MYEGHTAKSLTQLIMLPYCYRQKDDQTAGWKKAKTKFVTEETKITTHRTFKAENQFYQSVSCTFCDNTCYLYRHTNGWVHLFLVGIVNPRGFLYCHLFEEDGSLKNITIIKQIVLCAKQLAPLGNSLTFLIQSINKSELNLGCKPVVTVCL